MSIVKNSKKYTSNGNLSEILSFMSHVKNNSNSTPFNLRNKNSLRNTLEKLNSKPKKNISSKKSKNNSKDSEIFINNYLSQRPCLNTEGNEKNSKKMKFSMDFFSSKKDQMFKIKNNKSISNKKRNKSNNDNFRTSIKNNFIFEIVKRPKKCEDSGILNKKNISNFKFTRFMGNNGNLYNKKLIEGNSKNEYNITNTNTQNFSHTQSYFNQNNKKINNNNQVVMGHQDNLRHSYRDDSKKSGAINSKIIKEKKMKNFSGLILQISPPFLNNNKLSHIQNYFRNIHKNKKVTINQKEKENNKEKNIITDDPKELNQEEEAEDFFLKDNSSNYLLVSKNPTQITNYIEKKENNKYINNYFNICESTNIEIKNDGNKKNEDRNDEDENDYDTFEEIHFYFIKKIQNGKKLKLNMNNKKS
jgi:hypothetical protein